ncbi:MAG TPA: hypothetical protein VGN79_12195 [Devosia sp.]|jgi:phage host-nuclease inhibitor protein Gam|nr:hypothetical protein [Devosia sp.]
MNEIALLITRIEAYCSREKIAESTFGRLAVNDGKLVSRLRAGGSLNMRTFSAVVAFLDKAPEHAGAVE